MKTMHIFSSTIEVPNGCCLGGYGDSDASKATRAGSLNVAGFGFREISTGALIEVCSLDALYAGELVKQQADQRVQRIYAASHTHFAPMLDASKPGLGRYSPEAVESIGHAIVSATRKQIEPNQCIVFRGEVSLPVYRRFDVPKSFINNVLTRYAGMFPNEAQKIDKGIYIFLFRDDVSNLFVITYHACHPVTRHDRNAISADYVEAIRQAISKRFGTSCCLFFLGCAGDIRPNFARKRVAWLPKSRFNWRFKHPPSEVDQDEADQQYRDAILKANQITAFSINSSSFLYKHQKLNIQGIGILPIPEVHIGNKVIFSFFPFEVSHLFHLTTYSPAMKPMKYIVSCSNQMIGYLPHPDQIPFGGYEVDGSRKDMGLKNRLLIREIF